MNEITLHLTVNNERHTIVTFPNKTLLDLLRDDLDLTGVKNGCEVGECGTCTVIMNGEPVNSCLVLVGQANGSIIETIEGLANEGILHPLQRAFVQNGAVQCGYCTPGVIMAAKSLLDSNPKSTPEEIQVALAGNLCRCTGYTKIIEAVETAAEEMSHE
jgi:carbon-monoxide dehydrogenase small subunit